ncbi:hypothetical protein L4D00_15065 [Photobacterium swingsii]|uniref:hypothetical protein n=1 Tax=Photobacterium swingsii TaxID=680026 RepID=UPI003D12DA96
MKLTHEDVKPKKNRPSNLRYNKPANQLMNDINTVHKIWLAHGKPKQCSFRTILIKEGYEVQKNITGTVRRLEAMTV